MSIVIRTAIRAMRSLFTAKMLTVLLASIVINAFVMLLLFGFITWITSATSIFSDYLLEWMFDWVTRFAALGATFLLFPLFLPIIVSFFDETIARDIEGNEYPNLPAASPPFWPTFTQDLGFTLKAIGLNILVLPLYIIFFFIPFMPLIIYYTLNGYLLGTEFFNMAAGRHIPIQEAKQLRAQNRLKLIGGGALIAFCATIPFVNLIAPIWGVAFMVHYFHSLRPKYTIEKSH